MTKEELVSEIKTAFKNVRLEDGIGLWEAQGIDDYADAKTIATLRQKDERHHWDKIPYEDLINCSSSLSFFDAKGMRFCLPQFLIFDILAEDFFEAQNNASPDVLFTLGYKLNEEYQKNRFSLFNHQQTQTIVHFLEYKLEEFTTRFKAYSANDTSKKSQIDTNHDYLELLRTVSEWKQKLE
jgi:hypothetical protein